MMVGTMDPKHPDSTVAVSINVATYMAPDTVSGLPVWTAPTGLAIVGTPSFASNVATALFSGGQEGCDYNLDCAVTLTSGVVEHFTVVVPVRTGAADPRLTR